MSPSDKESSSRPQDPFELWRQIYDTNERAWSAILERTVNNPAFAESTGKVLETFLSAQKTVRENMRSYLEQINLPTREDIARLGELIVALEEKVDQLDDRLSSIEAALRAQAAASPAASQAERKPAPAEAKPSTSEAKSTTRASRPPSASGQ